MIDIDSYFVCNCILYMAIVDYLYTRHSDLLHYSSFFIHFQVAYESAFQAGHKVVLLHVVLGSILELVMHLEDLLRTVQRTSIYSLI